MTLVQESLSPTHFHPWGGPLLHRWISRIAWTWSPLTKEAATALRSCTRHDSHPPGDDSRLLLSVSHSRWHPATWHRSIGIHRLILLPSCCCFLKLNEHEKGIFFSGDKRQQTESIHEWSVSCHVCSAKSKSAQEQIWEFQCTTCGWGGCWCVGSWDHCAAAPHKKHTPNFKNLMASTSQHVQRLKKRTSVICPVCVCVSRKNKNTNCVK